MTDTLDDTEAASVLVCGIDGCTEIFEGPLAPRMLGGHKYRAHGIAGASKTASKKAPSQPAGAPRASVPGRGPTQPAQPTATMSDMELATGLMELYMLLSMLFTLRGDQVCGAAVVKCSDKAAAAWVRVARRNPDLRKRLEQVAGISWLSLLIAHLPLIESVRDHHVVPAMERRQHRVAEQRAQRQPGGTGREDPARSRFEEAMARDANGNQPPAES